MTLKSIVIKINMTRINKFCTIKMSFSAVYNFQQETEERMPAEHPFTEHQAGVCSYSVYSMAFFH